MSSRTPIGTHLHISHPFMPACGFVGDALRAPGLSLRSAVDNARGRTSPPTGLPTARPFAHKLHRP